MFIADPGPEPRSPDPRPHTFLLTRKEEMQGATVPCPLCPARYSLGAGATGGGEGNRRVRASPREWVSRWHERDVAASPCPFAALLGLPAFCDPELGHRHRQLKESCSPTKD